jgi:hypothetical protein
LYAVNDSSRVHFGYGMKHLVAHPRGTECLPF